jgi:hypothetical protein
MAITQLIPVPAGNNGPSRYLTSTRTLVTISPIDTEIGILPVSGIIPPEYGFSVANKYDPLLSGDQGIAEAQKAVNTFNEFIKDTSLSLVPYSPQIWMGSDPLSISEMTLNFVAYENPYIEVHLNLMNLLAMGLPGGTGTGERLGFEMGMLTAPPSVEIKIGGVITWSPCYLETVVVTEFAPYTKEGFGMRGEAKIKIIRRDFVFGGDFAKNFTNPAVRPVTSAPPAAVGAPGNIGDAANSALRYM